MATNIIERLFIEIGLDFDKYATDADKAVEKNRRLEDSMSDTEVASKKAGKELGALGEHTDKTAQRFSLLETTLLRSTGLEKWVNDIADAEDALKSSAANLGIHEQALKKWHNAAKNAGGNEAGITSLLEKMNAMTVEQAATGKRNPVLQELGVDLTTADGKARNLNDVMFKLSESLQKLNRPHAYSVAKSMGMDSGTANLMMQGEKGIKTLMDKPFQGDKINKAQVGFKNLAQTIQQGAKAFAMFTALLLGGRGLMKLAADAADANVAVSNLSKNIGMSVKNLREWQNMAAMSGGSAEGMASSLQGLSRSISDFVVMGDTSLLPYFNALGVGMVDGYGKIRKMDDILLDLSESLSKMDRRQAYSIASSMGLDEGTINTLLQGREAMQEMLAIQKGMYHSSEQDLALSRELVRQKALMNAHWQSLKTLLANMLLPILLKLITVVNGWFSFIQRHERQVRHVFEALAMVIGMLLIPMLLKAVLALAAFLAPFAVATIAVTALAAAFILLYDDYKTWAEGGDSLFDWGAFAGYIKNSKVSVDSLANSFAYLLTGYKTWGEFAKNFNVWDAIKNAIDDIIARLKVFISIMSKVLTGDFKGAWAEYSQYISDTFSDITNRVKGAVDVATGQEVGTLQNATEGQDNKPYPAGMWAAGNVGLAAGNNAAPAKTSNKQSLLHAGVVGGDIGGGGKAPVKREEQLSGNTLKLTEDDVVLIMKVASTEVVRGLKGDAYENQVKGVVDTILNRTASGKFGKGVKGVANQPWAFSDINTPRKSAYGNVDNVPMSRITPRLEKVVRGHLQARANGTASSVGDNVYYANPYYLFEASAKTKAWVKEVEQQANMTGYRYGAGKAVHVHGTPKADAHEKPKAYNIQLSSSSMVNQDAIKRTGEFLNAGKIMQRNSNPITNNNQKYIDISVKEVSVNTTASSISGTSADAVRAIGAHVNQLITGVS